MFKVSFKESPENHWKLVVKEGKETTVMLRGVVAIPEFWKYRPLEIDNWIAHQTHIECFEDFNNNLLVIYAKGVSKCHPDDKYDTILGERMAESRAKYVLYKFFSELCHKLCEYYISIVAGVEGASITSANCGLIGTYKKYERLCQHEKNHQKELLEEKNHE